MQPGLLPLFPLQVVLLPGGELPLHIFEDRYKEMMREVIRDHLEFGVVLAGEKGIVNTGCSATVDRVLQQYPDGRMDIVTRGRRRFEIVRLNDERAFLRGTVDFFDDDFIDDDPTPESSEIRQRAIDGYKELQALSENAAAETPESAIDATNQRDSQLSFRLAQSVPDLGFRQALLTTRSEGERLRQLAEFLPAYLIRQRRIQHMKVVVPRNGHGGGHEVK
jgi:Lon protease-like protein